MSWADIAAKNAPPPESQPKPDESLLEGHHFAGEHTYKDSDAHLAIVKDFDEVTPQSAAAPSHSTLEPIHRNPAPQPGSEQPHVSEVAPKPTPAPAAHPFPSTTTTSSDSKSGSVNTTSTSTSSEKEKDKTEMSSNQSNQQTGAKAGRKFDEAEQKAKEVYDMSAEEKGAKVGKKIDAAEDAVAEKADEAKDKAKDLAAAAKRDAKKLKAEASAELEKAENTIAYYYEKTKDVVLRPGTLGGVMGIANVGLLSFLGYTAYLHKDDRVWNRNLVGAAVAGTVGLFAVEGIVAEQYATTPEGRADVEKSKREGSRAYNIARENILRPGVAGGLLGVVNLAILGGLGYFGYERRNQSWDPKIVSGIVCGLVGLSAAEGLATNVYQVKELPEQKRKGNA